MKASKCCKTLAAAMAAVMVMAAGALAQGPWSCGLNGAHVTATLSGGTLTISGAGAMADYGVLGNGVPSPWDDYRLSITRVVIENGVTSVGATAFEQCHNLTSVTIPNGVTSIGNATFHGCKSLTSVTIPNGVTSIGEMAFHSCESLTSVTIPNGVTSIGNYAFCFSGLTSVTFPNSIDSITGTQFYDCKNLTSVTSLKTFPPILNTDVFSGVNMASLTLYVPHPATYRSAAVWKDFGSIKALDGSDGSLEWDCGEVPGTISAVLDANGTLTISGSGAMNHYTPNREAPWMNYSSAITKVVIGVGVTSIGMTAFSSCTSLTSITIPNGVTTIALQAFYGCTGLTSVTIPNSVTSIGSSVFSGCSRLVSIDVGEGNSVYSSIDGVLFNKSKDTLLNYPIGRQGAYIIPNSVTYIGAAAFANSTGLTSLTCLTVIPPDNGANSFMRVPIASITLYVPSIAVAAYQNAITVWGSFGSIQALAALTEWDCGTVPGTITATLNADGMLTVSGSGAMADYVVTGSEAMGWGSTAPWADYRNSITGVVIGNGVTSVGGATFIGCRNLASVSIPNSVTSIKNHAFYECTSLKSITIPDGVISIGSYTFMESGLTSVVIPNSVTSLTNNTFRNCVNLTSVTIGTGVTSIVSEMFLGCTSLTSVTIHSGVTSIGGGAFRSCTGLTSVTSLAEVPPNIVRDAFQDVDVASVALYVPEESIEAYGSANVWKDFDIQDVATSVASADRVVPNCNPGEVVVVAPVRIFAGEFTAGPNPVGRSSGGIAFFWQGGSLSGGSLAVYDASGNVVRKLGIKDATIGNAGKRAVGSWDLKDAKGRQVSEGTYLVKGKIVTPGGKGERVSAVVGVR